MILAALKDELITEKIAKSIKHKLHTVKSIEKLYTLSFLNIFSF